MSMDGQKNGMTPPASSLSVSHSHRLDVVVSKAGMREEAYWHPSNVRRRSPQQVVGPSG